MKQTKQPVPQAKRKLYNSPFFLIPATLVAFFVIGGGSTIYAAQRNGHCIKMPFGSSGNSYDSSAMSMSIDDGWHSSECSKGEAASPTGDVDSTARNYSWISSPPRAKFIQDYFKDVSSTNLNGNKPTAAIQVYEHKADGNDLSVIKSGSTATGNTYTDAMIGTENAVLFETPVIKSTLEGSASASYNKSINFVHNGELINVVFAVSASTEDEVERLRDGWSDEFEASIKSIELK